VRRGRGRTVDLNHRRSLTCPGCCAGSADDYNCDGTSNCDDDDDDNDGTPDCEDTDDDNDGILDASDDDDDNDGIQDGNEAECPGGGGAPNDHVPRLEPHSLAVATAGIITLAIFTRRRPTPQ